MKKQGISNSFCIQFGYWENIQATGTITFPIAFTAVYSFVSRVLSDKSQATDDKYFGYALTKSNVYRPKGTSDVPVYYIVTGKKS